MTKDEFNELPEDARQFIEANVNCLGCGNAESKMDKAFELYKKNKLQSAFIIFGGGINYNLDGKQGTLTSLKDTDNDFVQLQKLTLARQFQESHPHIFKAYNSDLVDKLIGILSEVESLEIVVYTDENKTGLKDENASILLGEKGNDLNENKSNDDLDKGIIEKLNEVPSILSNINNDNELKNASEFNLETASYDDMKTFVKSKDIETASQSKADYIKAITLFLESNK